MIALKICLTAAILAYICAKNIDEFMEAVTREHDLWYYATGVFGGIMLISAIVAIWQLL